MASLSYFYVQCKDSKSDHHEGFQTKQDSKKKKKKRSIYTCMIFLSICLSDPVPFLIRSPRGLSNKAGLEKKKKIHIHIYNFPFYLFVRSCTTRANPITTRAFKQSRTRKKKKKKKKKKKIHIHMYDFPFCLFVSSCTTPLELPFCSPVFAGINLGPVVQSVVSLTSSFRVISLTVLADSYTIFYYFFLKKKM